MVQERRQPDPFIPPCGVNVCGPSPGIRLPSSGSGACCSGPHCPWPRPFPPPPPRPRTRLCSAASPVLWAGPTSTDRASSDWGIPPCRCGPRGRTSPSGQPVDLPVPVQMASTRAGGLLTTQSRVALAVTRHPMLPSASSTASALRMKIFAARWLRPRVPLSTLRRRPHGRPRMTRGHRDWLGLQRTELASATTCRSPGARRGFDDSSSPSAKPPIRDILFPLLISGRKPAEVRPSPANCPNHEDGLRGPFWAISCLSSAPFSDATEPRPFWYGCWKLDNSMSWRTPEGNGFERIPARAE